MPIDLSYVQLADAVGISRSYAHELLNTDKTPSRPLAFTIFQKTGMKLGPLAGIADDDITTLARIEGIPA